MATRLSTENNDRRCITDMSHVMNFSWKIPSKFLKSTADAYIPMCETYIDIPNNKNEERNKYIIDLARI